MGVVLLNILDSEVKFLVLFGSEKRTIPTTVKRALLGSLLETICEPLKGWIIDLGYCVQKSSKSESVAHI